MPTLYLEWGGDFITTPSGSLQIASGWDEVRQRIERALLTNPLTVGEDGTPYPPDYLFDTNFGEGAGIEVDEHITAEMLNSFIQKVNTVCMSDPDVDSSSPPTVNFYRISPNNLYTIIGVVLATGEEGQISVLLK